MKISLTNVEHIDSPEIKAYRERLVAGKERAQEIKDEQAANNIWRASESLNVNILFIKAFDNLKSGNYREAWNLLERCEVNCSFIERNSDEKFLSESRIFLSRRPLKTFNPCTHTVFLLAQDLLWVITPAAYAGTR